METERDSTWPYASLLFYGFFGSHDAEGRRLVRRTISAWLLIMAGMLTLGADWAGGARWAMVAIVVLGGLLMVWANRRYVASLDELAASIQLGSFAVAYGVVVVMILGMIAVAFALDRMIDPLILLVVFPMAEPVRGLILARLARRYE